MVEALDLELPGGEHHRVVLRRLGAAEWKQHDPEVMIREYRILRALRGLDLPVPEPLLFDRGELFGSPALVMEWVDGTTGLPDRERSSAVEQMAHFLAALHAVDTTALADLPRREDPVSGALKYLADSAPAELRALLEARGPLGEPFQPSLLHGDFWPGNILWREHRIAAVLDWEDAALGDPLSDLATARLELLHGAGAESAEAFTRHYVAASGIRPDPDRLAVWELYVAFAVLATVAHWGLEPAHEQRVREGAERSAAEATRHLLRR